MMTPDEFKRLARLYAAGFVVFVLGGLAGWGLGSC